MLERKCLIIIQTTKGLRATICLVGLRTCEMLYTQTFDCNCDTEENILIALKNVQTGLQTAEIVPPSDIRLYLIPTTALFREWTFPFRSKIKIKQALSLLLDAEFPFGSGTLEHRTYYAQSLSLEKNTQVITVSCFDTSINPWVDAFEELDWYPSLITFDPFPLLYALPKSLEVQLVLHVQEQHSTVSIVDQGIVRRIRYIYGGLSIEEFEALGIKVIDDLGIENIEIEDLTPNKEISDNAVSNKAISYKSISEKAISEKAIIDNAISDKVITDNASPEKAISENAISDNEIIANASPEKIAPSKEILDKLQNSPAMKALLRDIAVVLDGIALKPTQLVLFGDCFVHSATAIALGKALNLPIAVLGQDIAYANDILQPAEKSMSRLAAMSLARMPAWVWRLQSRCPSFHRQHFVQSALLTRYQKYIAPLGVVALVLLCYLVSVWAQGYSLNNQASHYETQTRQIFQEAAPGSRTNLSMRQMRSVLASKIQDTQNVYDERTSYFILKALRGIHTAIPNAIQIRINRISFDRDRCQISGIAGSYEQVESIRQEIAKLDNVEEVQILRATAQASNDLPISTQNTNNVGQGSVSFDLAITFNGKR